jgi:uncharacterized protein YlbG (UPF0298 family)
MKKRVGLAVWVNNIRTVRHLKRFGNIHYVSKRFKYVVLYVDADLVEEIEKQLGSLRFVTRFERSYRHEIPTVYQNSKQDHAKDYDYRVGV